MCHFASVLKRNDISTGGVETSLIICLYSRAEESVYYNNVLNKKFLYILKSLM